MEEEKKTSKKSEYSSSSESQSSEGKTARKRKNRSENSREAEKFEDIHHKDEFLNKGEKAVVGSQSVIPPEKSPSGDGNHHDDDYLRSPPKKKIRSPTNINTDPKEDQHQPQPSSLVNISEDLFSKIQFPKSNRQRFAHPGKLDGDKMEKNWEYWRLLSEEMYSVLNRHHEFNGDYLSLKMIGEFFHEAVNTSEFEASMSILAVQVTKVCDIFRYGKNQKRLVIHADDFPTANSSGNVNTRKRKICVHGSLADLFVTTVIAGDVLVILCGQHFIGLELAVLNAPMMVPPTPDNKVTIIHYRHQKIFSLDTLEKNEDSQLDYTALKKLMNDGRFESERHEINETEARVMMRPVNFRSVIADNGNENGQDISDMDCSMNVEVEVQTPKTKKTDDNYNGENENNSKQTESDNEKEIFSASDSENEGLGQNQKQSKVSHVAVLVKKKLVYPPPHVFEQSSSLSDSTKSGVDADSISDPNSDLNVIGGDVDPTPNSDGFDKNKNTDFNTAIEGNDSNGNDSPQDFFTCSTEDDNDDDGISEKQNINTKPSQGVQIEERKDNTHRSEDKNDHELDSKMYLSNTDTDDGDSDNLVIDLEATVKRTGSSGSSSSTNSERSFFIHDRSCDEFPLNKNNRSVDKNENRKSLSDLIASAIDHKKNNDDDEIPSPKTIGSSPKSIGKENGTNISTNAAIIANSNNALRNQDQDMESSVIQDLLTQEPVDELHVNNENENYDGSNEDFNSKSIIMDTSGVSEKLSNNNIILCEISSEQGEPNGTGTTGNEISTSRSSRSDSDSDFSSSERHNENSATNLVDLVPEDANKKKNMMSKCGW